MEKKSNKKTKKPLSSYKKKVLFLLFFLSAFFLLSFQTTKAKPEEERSKEKTEEASNVKTDSSFHPSSKSSHPMFSPKSLSLIQSALSPIKTLPIQSGGRIKPFDSFAKESLQLIYGRKNFKGQEASHVVFTWLLLPSTWEQAKLMEIKNHSLKKDLGFPTKDSHFSAMEIKQNEKIPLLMEELNQKREGKEKLNSYFEAVQRLENQMNLFYALAYGQALPVAPSKEEVSRWLTLRELKGELKTKFEDVLQSFTKTLSLFSHSSLSYQEKTLKEKDPSLQSHFKTALTRFIQAAKAEAPEKYAQMEKIQAEVHYNNLKPFFWSWIIYLMSFFFFLFHVFFSSTHAKERLFSLKFSFYKLGWGLLFVGFLLHSYGILLRVYIMERPPVTNMYETVLWVPWGSALFAMIFDLIYKQIYPLMAASLVSVLCLLISDLAPSVLDGSLNPLQPVLRDNFWLVVHVMTICLSYAAFFLALFQADILLLFYILNEKKYKTQIKKGAQSIYRFLQVGVLLLGTGTVLGGLWADMSWGRFWGWDPKETWALITLLGYLALLHGRLSGWIKEFGMVAGSIVAFSLVIMAWYGVNFVLGEGLHSYGFGTGGRGFVFSFASLHFLFVLYAFLIRKRKALRV